MNDILMRQTVPVQANTKAVDFSSLSMEEQKKHFLKVAQKALALWGYPADSKLKLLNITENATYRVEHKGFDTIVMRVHRLIYAEKESIQTEIAWLLDLGRDTDLNLATPLKGLDGNYVQTVTTPQMNEQRYVVCFSYVKGKAPRDSHDDVGQISGIAVILNKLPKKLTIPLFRRAAVLYDEFNRKFPPKDTLTDNDKAMYHKLGEIAATLHQHSKGWTPPKYYKRIEWNWKATFSEGWNNFYGAHYRDLEGMLKESDLETIDACAFLMYKRIEAYGKSPARYGMIHSDLRMANLLQNDSKITVLDFDDSGMGWYMYDIASIVGFMEHRPDLQAIINVIVEGYRAKIDLPDEDVTEIPTFIMMRRIGLLQAIIYHIGNVDPGSGEAAEITPEIMAFYAKGTVVLAKKYIEQYKNIPLAAIKE